MGGKSLKAKPTDFFVIIILLISVFFLKNIFVSTGFPTLILVTEDGEKEISFQDNIYNLQEDTGHKMLLEVKDGKARFKESDCLGQICVNSWVSSCGDAAVCVPNKTAIYIRCENEDSQLDAISR